MGWPQGSVFVPSLFSNCISNHVQNWTLDTFSLCLQTVSPYSISNLSKWQLYPSSGSNQKPGHRSWFIFFTLHSISLQTQDPTLSMSRIWPLLSSLTATTLVSATIMSHLDCCKSFISSPWVPVMYCWITKPPNTRWHKTTTILLCSQILLVRNSEIDVGGTALPCSDIWGLSCDESVNWAWNSWARRICLEDGFLTPMSGIQAGMGEKQDKPRWWIGFPHGLSSRKDSRRVV